jgi:hypothetical protein
MGPLVEPLCTGSVPRALPEAVPLFVVPLTGFPLRVKHCPVTVTESQESEYVVSDTFPKPAALKFTSRQRLLLPFPHVAVGPVMKCAFCAKVGAAVISKPAMARHEAVNIRLMCVSLG